MVSTHSQPSDARKGCEETSAPTCQPSKTNAKSRLGRLKIARLHEMPSIHDAVVSNAPCADSPSSACQIDSLGADVTSGARNELDGRHAKHAQCLSTRARTQQQKTAALRIIVQTIARKRRVQLPGCGRVVTPARKQILPSSPIQPSQICSSVLETSRSVPSFHCRFLCSQPCSDPPANGAAKV